MDATIGYQTLLNQTDYNANNMYFSGLTPDSLLYVNDSNTLGNATIGSGISFAAGTLSVNSAFIRGLLSAGTGLNYNSSTGVFTNTGVTSVTGTANQVIANAATGAITLSLPQSIATSSNVQHGSLGLGVSPGYPLHIKNTSNPQLVIDSNAGATSEFRHYVAGVLTSTFFATATSLNLRSVTSIPLYLGAANTNYMTILTNGKVGIGTTIPGNLLTLANNNFIAWRNNANNTETAGITSTTADDMQFYVSGVKMTILPSGLVSVGGTIADTVSKFEVFDTNNLGITINAPTPRYNMYESDAAADEKWWDTLAVSGTLSCRAVNDAQSAASNWMVVDRSGYTIDSVTFPNGKIGIGTTPSYLLHLAGSQTNNVNMMFTSTTVAPGANADMYGLIHYGRLNHVSGTANFATGQYLALTLTVPAATTVVNACSVACVQPTNAGAGSVTNARNLQAAAPTIGTACNIATWTENIAVGSGYFSTTPPTYGAIIQGNVGIGTLPGTKLQVTADANILSNWKLAQFRIGGSTNSNYQLNMGYDTTNNEAVIQAGEDGTAYRNLCLNPFGGCVGIGSTSFTAALQIATGGATDNANYGKAIQTVRPTTCAVHLAMVRQGARVWGLGYVYNSNNFAIFNTPSTTETSNTSPAFSIDTFNNASFAANVGVGGFLSVTGGASVGGSQTITGNLQTGAFQNYVDQAAFAQLYLSGGTSTMFFAAPSNAKYTGFDTAGTSQYYTADVTNKYVTNGASAYRGGYARISATGSLATSSVGQVQIYLYDSFSGVTISSPFLISTTTTTQYVPFHVEMVYQFNWKARAELYIGWASAGSCTVTLYCPKLTAMRIGS